MRGKSDLRLQITDYGFIIGLLFIVPCALRAQEQPTPAVLTLPDAIELARQYNPQYRQAINRLDGAAAQVRSGFGQFLPRLDVGASFNGSTSKTVTGQNDAGEPITLPRPVEFRSSSANQSINASWELFNGLGNINNYRSTKASQVSAEASADATAWNVEAETTRRFYEILRAIRQLELEQVLLEQFQDRLARTERLFAVTTSQTQEDVLGARADAATQQVQVDVAGGDLAKTKLALREQIGIEDHFEFDVVGDLPALFDPMLLNADSLVEVAMAVSPDVHSLDASSDAASARASSTRGARWPSVRLNAGYIRSVSLRSYDALTEFNPQNSTFTFGLGINWSLFTGFQTSAQVTQADVDARNARESLREGRLRVERSVRSALIDVQNASRSLNSAQISADLNRERVRLAEERYAIGAVQFSTLQQYVETSARADRTLITARFTFASSVVNMDQAVGQRVRP